MGPVMNLLLALVVMARRAVSGRDRCRSYEQQPVVIGAVRRSLGGRGGGLQLGRPRLSRSTGTPWTPGTSSSMAIVLEGEARSRRSRTCATERPLTATLVPDAGGQVRDRATSASCRSCTRRSQQRQPEPAGRRGRAAAGRRRARRGRRARDITYHKLLSTPIKAHPAAAADADHPRGGDERADHGHAAPDRGRSRLLGSVHRRPDSARSKHSPSNPARSKR